MSAQGSTGGGVDTRCIALSASRRTFDSCFSEFRARAPDFLKVIARSWKGSSAVVFRDHVLSFVSFQEAFWLGAGCVNCLVLGFVNGGVQIWRLNSNAIPGATRIASFKTNRQVAIAQLLDDLPSTNSNDNGGREARVAVVCAVLPPLVGVFRTEGHCWHVLQQPWPIIDLKASLCRVKGGWIGTLIRVYNTSDFELRFSISRFQSTTLPPLWQWLAADSERKAIGPVVAFCGRWLAYQERNDDVAVDGNLVDHDQGQSQSVNFQEDRNQVVYSSNPNARLSWFPRLQSYIQSSRHNTSPLSGLTTRVLSALPETWTDGSTYRTLPTLSLGNPAPPGGPIIVVDVVSGQRIGRVTIPFVNVEESSTAGAAPDCHSVRTSVEVEDGSWCLSHMNISKSSDNNRVTPTPDSPLMAHLAFDSTGTTLFCAEWTGRTIFVCRLTAMARDKAGSLNSSENAGLLSQKSNHVVTAAGSNGVDILSGTVLTELSRGKTAGSVIYVKSSRNISGEVCIMVLTSRGTCHIFSLPSGFNLSHPSMDKIQQLAYPVSCRSASHHVSQSQGEACRGNGEGIDGPPPITTRLEVLIGHKKGGKAVEVTKVAPTCKVSLISPPPQYPECLLDEFLSQPSCFWKGVFLSRSFLINEEQHPFPHTQNHSPSHKLLKQVPHLSTVSMHLPLLTASSDGVLEWWNATYITDSSSKTILQHQGTHQEALTCAWPSGPNDADESPIAPRWGSLESSRRYLTTSLTPRLVSLERRRMLSTRDLQFAETMTSSATLLTSRPCLKDHVLTGIVQNNSVAGNTAPSPSETVVAWSRFCEPLTAPLKSYGVKQRHLSRSEIFAASSTSLSVSAQRREPGDGSNSTNSYQCPSGSNLAEEVLNVLLRNGHSIEKVTSSCQRRLLLDEQRDFLEHRLHAAMSQPLRQSPISTAGTQRKVTSSNRVSSQGQFSSSAAESANNVGWKVEEYVRFIC